LESISGVSRILLSTSGDVLQLLRDLLGFYSEPFKIALVMDSPPLGHDYCRLEAAERSRADVLSLFDSFSHLLRTDARFQLWIHSVSAGGGSLVMDDHGWLYVYGHLEAVEELLVSIGLKLGRPELPFPHVHNEDPRNNEEFANLLKYWDWLPRPR
jgi:hypothetical protein